MFIALLFGITHLPLTKVRNNANLPINQIEGFSNVQKGLTAVEKGVTAAEANIINHFNVVLKNVEQANKPIQKSIPVSL